MNDYEIVRVEQPDWEIIGGGIEEFNKAQAGDDDAQNMCFLVKDQDGKTVGGVIAATYWNWLYINLMWVREDLRSQGFGSELLTKAEEEGRKRGAKFAYLDTFSFQAPDFYKKFGYEVFGQLEDFPQGHQRIFLRKAL